MIKGVRDVSRKHRSMCYQCGKEQQLGRVRRKEVSCVLAMGGRSPACLLGDPGEDIPVVAMQSKPTKA